MKPTSFLKWLKSLSVKSILLLSSGLVVLIATIVALSGTISSASKRMEKNLYGEEIGNNHLRYKYGCHIYNPETGKMEAASGEYIIYYGGTSDISKLRKLRIRI